MLRDASLIPLSRQHQHALALCVQIERALKNDRALKSDAIDLAAWQIEADQNYEHEIGGHFDAEEQVLFPAARRFPELGPLVDELTHEHEVLREHFGRAKIQAMDRAELAAFANQLSSHIRKEERQLFESLQKLMAKEELAALGKALEVTELTNASCRLRNNGPAQ